MQCPIWEAGENGVLLDADTRFHRHKLHRLLRISTDLTDKKHNNSVFLSKNGKKAPFLAILSTIEIRTLSLIISLKCAEFLALTPVYGVRGQAGIVVLGEILCLIETGNRYNGAMIFGLLYRPLWFFRYIVQLKLDL